MTYSSSIFKVVTARISSSLNRACPYSRPHSDVDSGPRLEGLSLTDARMDAYRKSGSQTFPGANLDIRISGETCPLQYGHPPFAATPLSRFMPGGYHVIRARLPIEIQEHIIDHLVNDVVSLRNCALTCRVWLPRSRSLLLCAFRIATRSSWDAAIDYFQENDRMRPLVRSITMAPAPTERMWLLGTYPSLLFRMLPNLRRWEIRAPVDAEKGMPRVVFHRTTLIQLRFSPITELHVSSIQFSSLTDFVRLLSSIPLLRVLEYTEIQFARAKGISSTTGTPLLRRPLSLSTLQNLVLRQGESLKWSPSGETDSLSVLLVGYLDLIAVRTITAITLAMTRLRSLTLHADQHPEDGVSAFLAKTFGEASNWVQALGRGSTLERLEIHIDMRDTFKNPQDRAFCNNLVELALSLLEVQDRCQTLQRVLLAGREMHLAIIIHIPSFWAPREVVLRTLREDSFPELQKKGVLDVEFSGGNVCQSYAPHNGQVSALAVSPDGRWVASGSRGLAIIWDAHTRQAVHEWVIPMAQPPSADSFAFSPDSTRIACCGYNRGRTSVEIRGVDDGHRISILEGYKINNNGGVLLSQLTCAWFPNQLIFVSLTCSTIVVQTWNAHTLEQSSTRKYVAPFQSGSLVLSPDGRHLVGLTVAGSTRCPMDNKHPTNHHRLRVGSRQRSRTASRPRSYPASRTRFTLPNYPLCVLWDLDTSGSGEVLLKGLDCERVLAASFDREGKRLALSLANHTIRIWNPKTRELLSMAEPTEELGLTAGPHRHLYPRMPPEVFSKAVTFAPDGRHLLSLRYMRTCDGQIETLLVAWDTLSRRPVLTCTEYEKYGDTVLSAVGRDGGVARFAPTCTHVAFTAGGGRVQDIDLSSGVPLKTRTFEGPQDLPAGRQFGLQRDHYNVTTSLVFSPDGRTLCWATRDGEVEIRSF
ncbi:hypothetical protein V8D89_007689 [Ganoderma adspersum]